MPAGRARRENSRFRTQAAPLARHLRQRREQMGLTQEQLAGAAGIALSTLRKIEDGRVVEPGYFTILSIAAALAVAVPSFEQPQTALPGS